MKKAKNIILSTLLAVVAILAIPQASKADLWARQEFIDGPVSESFGENKEEPVDIRVRIVSIINISLTLLGIVSVVLIVFAGFKWMLSAGNDGQIKDAQKILSGAVIGLVIILLSWSITVFVLKNLHEKTGTKTAQLVNQK